MLIVMSKKEPKIAIPDRPLEVTHFATTGQGIGTLKSSLYINSRPSSDLNGIKILLWNTIPGEAVSKFQIIKQKPHFIEGIALEIDKTSDSRITPKDTQYLSTSPWQIISPSSELQAKTAILSSLFNQLKNQFHDIDFPPQIPICESPNNYFYRNKMEYSLYFDHQSEKIQLAVHVRGSHRKLPITTSSLELSSIFEQANTIISELNRTRQDARTFQSLLLRANQAGVVSGGLLENGKPHPVFSNLTDTLLDNNYSYSPNSFFQINLPIYEQVLLKIKNFLADSKIVLDLYSGVGTIGLSVARDKALTLVEINLQAYQELVANSHLAIQESHNPHIHPILAKSESVLDLVTGEASIILDPPRTGCDNQLVQKICSVKPPKIVYLSCNPITQVRDLAPLLGLYQISEIQGYNFFPRTPHIESLVLLSRKPMKE